MATRRDITKLRYFWLKYRKKYGNVIISISLPWPDFRLSPNSRTHNKARIPYVQAAREAAFCAVREQPQYDWTGLDGGLVLIVTAHPPDNRRRDLDNVLASCKHYQDGLCQALHIDDRQITEERIAWGNRIADGQIVMSLITKGEGK